MLQLTPLSHAVNTLQNARRLALRYQKWATDSNISLVLIWEERTWVQYARQLLASGLLPSTIDNYTRVFTQLTTWRDVSPVTILLRQLRNAGSLVTTHQATPLAKEALQHPCLGNHRLQFWLAWKTASRWDDISHLTTASFTIVSPGELHVDWERHTKSSKADPHRPSRYTVIVGDMTVELSSWVATLTDPIPWLTTAQASALLKKVDPAYSAHSIKRGATTLLTDAVSAGILTFPILSRLAKHAEPDGPSKTTLRYMGNPRAMARALETWKATALL